MTQKKRSTLCLGLAIGLALAASCEPRVSLIAPRLTAGNAQLQALLDQEVQANAGAIKKIVNEAIDKPQFLKGSAVANAEAALLPASPLIADRRYFSFTVGSYAAVTSDTLEPRLLQERLDNFQLKDDFAMGAGLQPLSLQLNIPMSFISRDLSLQAAFGLMRLRYRGFDFSSLLVQGGLNWQCLRPVGKSRLLRWEGLTLGLGCAWSTNSFGTRASPGAISRSFSVDPDEGGPFLAIPLSVSLDPSFDISLESSSLLLPLHITTGLRVLGSLSLQAGAGLYPIWGRSAIRLNSVAGTTDLRVDSYLAKSIERNGSISVSGSSDPMQARAFGGFINVGLGLETGPCGIRLPLLWDFDTGLCAGMLIGIAI